MSYFSSMSPNTSIVTEETSAFGATQTYLKSIDFPACRVVTRNLQDDK